MKGTAGLTHATPKKWQDRFLADLRDHGNVRVASEAASVSHATAYRHRERNPAFATAWDEALEEAIQSLEYVAHQRAREGSDTLLIFLLKAHRPEKYRETVHTEHDVKGGVDIRISRYIAKGDDQP